MKPITLALVFVAIIATGCPTHNLLRETPVKWDVDLEAMERQHFDETLTHVIPEGLIVYMKRPPGDVAALYRQGTAQADGAYFNGYLLAALCFKWAVTKDDAILELARRVWDGHHRLVTGSGYAGLVARSFGKNDPGGPLVYRRDGSGDQLIGWLFGTSVFVKLIDDPERRAQAAADVKAIAEHLRRHDLKIYLNADSPTPHGDFKTPVMGIPIGHYAIAAMAVAVLAVELNPGDDACEGFLSWLVGMDYHRQTRFFYSEFPHHSDNTAAYCLNLFTVWLNDETPHRRKFYLEGADAMWARAYDWQMALFGLVYKFVGGDEHAGHVRDSIDRLRNVPPFYGRLVGESDHKKTHVKIVPMESRPMSSSYWALNVFEEVTTQEGERDPVAYARVDFLLAYWLGRWLGEYGPASVVHK